MQRAICSTAVPKLVGKGRRHILYRQKRGLMAPGPHRFRVDLVVH